jgi:hypothetical protein
MLKTFVAAARWDVNWRPPRGAHGGGRARPHAWGCDAYERESKLKLVSLPREVAAYQPAEPNARGGLPRRKEMALAASVT